MPPRALHQGEVILVPFPFADLTGKKLRPAVIVSVDPQGPELIIAFITSVLTNRSPRGAEVELLRGDPEFSVSGLKTDSLVRLDKLVTVSRAVISRRLGAVGSATKAKLLASLGLAFGL